MAGGEAAGQAALQPPTEDIQHLPPRPLMCSSKAAEDGQDVPSFEGRAFHPPAASFGSSALAVSMLLASVAKERRTVHGRGMKEEAVTTSQRSHSNSKNGPSVAEAVGGGGEGDRAGRGEEAATNTQAETSLPLKFTAKSVIILSEWSMVMVPNNARITQVSTDLCRDWVVLIGRREDMTEMWHSSLISSRLSLEQVTTGSGRVYQTQGPISEMAMAEHGFSMAFFRQFRDGFPHNWKDLVITETLRIRSVAEQSSLPSYNGMGIGRRADLNRGQRRCGQYEYANEDPYVDGVEQAIKKSPACGLSDREQRREDENTPPYSSRARSSATAASKSEPGDDGAGMRGGRGVANPSGEELRAHQVGQDGRYRSPWSATIESSRSGRRLVKPLPYWENIYLEQKTPKSAIVKRRWGNHLGIGDCDE